MGFRFIWLPSDKLAEANADETSYLPSDTTGLQLVLDYRIGLKKAVGGDPATLANDEIGYWEDQSGQGNHFSQTTMADKLTLKDDGGLLIPEADGVSDFLEVVSLLGAGGTSARTLFILLKHLSTPTNAKPSFVINPDGASPPGDYWAVTGEVALRVDGANQVFDDSLSTSAYEYLTMRNPTTANVTQSEAWLNGTSLGVLSSSAAAINVTGTKTALARILSLYTDCRIKTVWFYNVEKSNADRAALEAEMALIP